MPQAVVAFAAVEVPTWSSDAPMWARRIAPDVVTNHAGERRAIVIVLDDFGIRRVPGVSRTARAIAARTIDELGPSDLAAVVYTLDRRHGQEFTVDRARLHAAVERFTPSGLAWQPPRRLEASAPTRGLSSSSQGGPPSGACRERSCVLSALRNTAEILRAWPNTRKTLVLISQGRALNAPEDATTLSEEWRRTLAALQQAHVTVYEFDPRGLEVEQQVTDAGRFAANTTGGRAIANTNAPEELVPQVLRESSSYYLLGFEPRNRQRDRRFRRVEVRVARPGARVHTRSGYYAPTDRTPEKRARPESAVERALSGGLPTGDLPMALTVAPFAAPSEPLAAVAIVAGIDRRAALPPGAVVELVAAAFDERWRQVAATKEQFPLPAEPDSASLLEVGAGLNLRPGRYEIRVAVSSAASASVGSVYTSATIPDFARAPLSLSGVVIERTPGGAVMPDALTAVLPAKPTTVRVFSPREPVAAIVRVRQGGSGSLLPVEIAARIVDQHDHVAFTASATLASALFGGRRESDYRLQLPLQHLDGGEHLLTIEATTKDSSIVRDVRFGVRRSAGSLR